MPQMAPINWISLYFLFTLIFIIFIILIYYLYLFSPNTHIQLTSKKLPSWKW